MIFSNGDFLKHFIYSISVSILYMLAIEIIYRQDASVNNTDINH